MEQRDETGEADARGMTNEQLLGLVAVGPFVTEERNPLTYAKVMAAGREIARRYEGTDLDPRTHVWAEREREPEREL